MWDHRMGVFKKSGRDQKENILAINPMRSYNQPKGFEWLNEHCSNGNKCNMLPT